MESPEIKNITLKNKAIKIQRAYRNYKTQLKINKKEESSDENIEKNEKISDNHSSHNDSQENIINENPDNGIR